MPLLNIISSFSGFIVALISEFTIGAVLTDGLLTTPSIPAPVPGFTRYVNGNIPAPCELHICRAKSVRLPQGPALFQARSRKSINGCSCKCGNEFMIKQTGLVGGQENLCKSKCLRFSSMDSMCVHL